MALPLVAVAAWAAATSTTNSGTGFVCRVSASQIRKFTKRGDRFIRSDRPFFASFRTTTQGATLITSHCKTTMQANEQHYYSPEAYLELEAAAEFRSEYYNGQIFPMAGGTPNHNRIIVNLVSALNVAFADQPYDVFASDLRLWLPRKNLYTYPDIMVVADELAFAEGRKDTITNPVAIVEVLSDSTKNYDRGEKFEFYRTLFSFREYLLIDQNKIHVEHCIKTTDNKWLLAEYEDVDTALSFASIPFQISLAALYKKVIF